MSQSYIYLSFANYKNNHSYDDVIFWAPGKLLMKFGLHDICSLIMHKTIVYYDMIIFVKPKLD